MCTKKIYLYAEKKNGKTPIKYFVVHYVIYYPIAERIKIQNLKSYSDFIC